MCVCISCVPPALRGELAWWLRRDRVRAECAGERVGAAAVVGQVLARRIVKPMSDLPVAYALLAGQPCVS